MLRLQNLSKSFGANGALFENLSLEIAPGEIVSIVGESGVGKSTLLNLIAGLDVPDNGTIALDALALAGLDDDALSMWRRKSLGFVFQAFHVLPYLSVAQNVTVPLKLNNWKDPEARARVAQMLDATGLAAKAHCRPRELSGGELQRIAIARALVHRPRLVLADEPTGNLDPKIAAAIVNLLVAEIRANRAAGVLVTHSALAAACADRTFRLTRHGLVENDK